MIGLNKEVFSPQVFLSRIWTLCDFPSIITVWNTYSPGALRGGCLPSARWRSGSDHACLLLLLLYFFPVIISDLFNQLKALYQFATSCMSSHLSLNSHEPWTCQQVRPDNMSQAKMMDGRPIALHHPVACAQTRASTHRTDSMGRYCVSTASGVSLSRSLFIVSLSIIKL